MTTKTNTLLQYRDLSACQCDITYNFCDPFCCCDNRCDKLLIFDWGQQSICYKNPAAVQTNFPLCSSLPGIYTDIKTLDFRQENTLTCLAFRNIPYMGLFYNEVPQSPSTDTLYLSLFQSFAYSNQNLASYSIDLTDYTNTNPTYKTGDYIRANTSLSYPILNNFYSIPTVDIFGFCQDENFLKYFIDMDPITCIRTLNISENCNENGTVSAYKLLKFYKIWSNPQGSSYLNVNVLQATSIDITTGSVVSKTIATDDDLKPKQAGNLTTSTCSCSNILKQADFYFILSNESNSALTDVSVNLVFYDSISLNSSCDQKLKFKQTFSITFLTTNYDLYYPKSGNPGYLLGKPLMSGYMISTLGLGKAVMLPRNGIPLNATLNDGTCSSVNDTNKVPFGPAVFGEDQEISCMIRLNLSGLQSMCNYASLSNYDIFNNFNTEQNIYIGRYGNANPLYINDWIQLNSTQTFASKTIKYDSTQLACFLPTTTLITVFYSRSGSTQNLQKYIVYAEKIFSTNSYWKYSKFDSSQNQSFSLVLKIQYIEITQSMISGLESSVPDYFSTWLSNLLRPFAITTGSNVFSINLQSNTLILLIYFIIVILIFAL